jgi:hypothetical protein
MGKVNHLSHGMGDAIIGHHKPNIAQDGSPKKLHGIAVAHGHRATDHAGATITKPTVAKRTAATPLGEAIMRQAFAAGDGMDCAAHGRNRDGSKC